MLLVALPAWADSAIRVRATPQFTELRVQASEGTTRIVGSLVDELHQPLEGARVTVSGALASPCLADGDVTDEAGQFCFKLEQHGEVETLRLKFAGSTYLDPVAFELPLREQPQPARIEIKPNPLRFDPGSPLYRVQVYVHANSSARSRYALRVVLERSGAPTRTLSGPSSVTSDSAVELTIAAAEVGPPGLAELSATLTHPSGHVVAEERMTAVVVGAVTLTWLAPPEARPADGLSAWVSVTSDGQAVDSGWVELLLDGHPVGMAEVRNGQAPVTVHLATPRRRTVSLEARYLPEVAWLRPGPALHGSVELLGRSPWSHLTWILLGLGTLLWLARTWRRPLRRRVEAAKPAHSASGRISVVERGGRDSGWRGTVRDAHTLEPLRDACVQIVVPSLTPRPPLRQALTLADGGFELTALTPIPEGARLVIGAPGHSLLERPLPPAGALNIELVTRRRALLEAFVRWVQHRTRPGSALPTPSEVSASAQREGEPSVAHWASEIERAAFGPTPPDAEREAALIRATPPLDRSGKLER